MIQKKEQQALVTGAGGFIGSHLSEILLEGGWKVRALVRYNSRSSIGWLEDVSPSLMDKMEVVYGDVNDPFQMEELTQGVDVVFHLAALIGIPYSYKAPDAYFKTNVMGTLNLLKGALKSGAKRFIHTSTSETYGTARYEPIDENHPLQGQSPYSASKIAADKLVESFICSFDLPAVIVRPFNTYGPRQSMRAVIPTVIMQALDKTEIQLGSLEPVRDLTFVSDTVSGFIAAAESDAVLGNVINIGTGTAISVGELTNTILEILDRDIPIVIDPKRIRPETSEVMKLISDNRRAFDLMKWKPRVSLRDGLYQTIDWFRSHKKSYKSEGYKI